MVKHITFCSSEMTKSADRCSFSAMKYGADVCTIYTPKDISSEFREFNWDIFNSIRGYSYWIWKPYIIYKELIDLPEDSYLIYTDAGVEVIHDIEWMLNYPTLIFGNNYEHEHWCKGNVTEEILGSRAARKQVQASAFGFKVTEENVNLVKRWLLWCQMPGFIDDSPGYDNDPEFQEHRHDQAIMTCLAYRYGYRLHYWPAMYPQGFYYENLYGDPYPITFLHHRKRNDEW